MLNPVIKNRLHEDIVAQIQKKILKGDFPIGQKLPTERDLATNLNVNRATVREALKKLEMLGLIEIHHGDGSYVKDYLESGNIEVLKYIIYMDDNIDYDIMQNLLVMRKVIIPPMSGFAALNRTEEQIDDLKKILTNKDLSILEQDLELHKIVAKASKNIFYIFVLNFFNQIFKDFGHIYFDDKKNASKSHKFHEDIIKSIEDKNAKKTEEIMHKILLYTETMIYKRFNIE